jgi:mediator of RNA polymerase II transcription subunit 21
MYASLNYVHTRHPYGDIPDQPPQAPLSESREVGRAATNGDGGQAVQQQAEGETGPSTPSPETQNTFNAALRELAQDLILKEQQIEYIINSLPGIGNSEADQERKMRELEVELRQVEEERAKKESERENMVDLLGEVIGKVKRVP